MGPNCPPSIEGARPSIHPSSQRTLVFSKIYTPVLVIYRDGNVTHLVSSRTELERVLRICDLTGLQHEEGVGRFILELNKVSSKGVPQGPKRICCAELNMINC